MTDTSRHDSDDTTGTAASLADHAAAGPDWKWTFALGIILILGGVIAFLNPFVASLTATAIAGGAFVAAGIVQAVMGLRGLDGTGSKIGAVLFGAVLALFGLSLWINPIAGILSLTILIGAFFVAMGAMRVWIAFRLRPRDGWGWMAGAGVVSVLLGLLVLFAVPAGAIGLLGIFLGVELISSGAGAVALALAVRRRQ
ncbi:acid-resistance membrane protein [Roseivivax jejudonensis]|uniref:Acid-resistance membrane protein n=1 Tax=Roseivivax jejudonensis TaxID=1529041 RepID=A0A1X6YC79_9RHOB|nr:HdeD family acid-resistance protein [Roseivivax jejudonensis]SLN16428.1 acid-resistance membrane protein [Roseivivax jejudonensis]